MRVREFAEEHELELKVVGLAIAAGFVGAYFGSKKGAMSAINNLKVNIVLKAANGMIPLTTLAG